MLKKLLAIVGILTISWVVFAAEIELKSDHPDTYVVQKGDTLWDIAAKFLTQPWLWPEIWQANPQVQNPHLIFPGDRLSLVYLNGRARIIREDLRPMVRSTQLEDAVTAVPLSEVLPFLKKARILTKEEIKTLPYVVGLEENHLRGIEGSNAYVRGLSMEAGARVLVLRPSYVYYDIPDRFPWVDVPRHAEGRQWGTDHGVTAERWWKEKVLVNHAYRRTWEYLGHEVIEIAYGRVLRAGEVSTVFITNGDRELRKGDLIIADQSLPFDLTFYPHAPKEVPHNMRVVTIGTTDSLYGVGPKNVVALSKGARDGVENGQVFAAFQPGEVIRDDIKYPDRDLRALFRPKKAKVQLPDEFAGNIMVFRTFEKVSYGLVMDGIRPIRVGALLREPLK